MGGQTPHQPPQQLGLEAVVPNMKQDPCEPDVTNASKYSIVEVKKREIKAFDNGIIKIKN